MNSEQKARELMAAIRYQVHRPEVTTMGRCSCPCGCESSARGSGMCAECIGMELDSLIDSSAGTAYVYACEAQRDAEMAVLCDAAAGWPVREDRVIRATAVPAISTGRRATHKARRHRR